MLGVMLAILAEPATTPEQIRSRGIRAVNAGRHVLPRRSRGQCPHSIRLDRNCDLCGRVVCRHGIGMHSSCPHCAAEADAGAHPAWTRFLITGQPRELSRPIMHALTTRQIMETADAATPDMARTKGRIVRVLFNGHDVTEQVLAVDEDKGEVLLVEPGSNAEPYVVHGRVTVERSSTNEGVRT